MKKLLSCLVLSAIICGSVVSCGDSSSSSSESSEPATEAPTEAPTEAEEDSSEEESSEPVAVAVDDVEFEDAVVPESGDAYLAIADSQWWIKYMGSNEDMLTYDAGVAHIDGNGDYTVSVTADTNGFRFDTTGDANDQYTPSGCVFSAVIIKDAEELLPDAIITINSIRIDGNEVELAKKGYTNTEDGNIRSNIFNSYVDDSALPGDARTADGALFEDFDSTKPTAINDGSYSAQIVDEAAFNNGWLTVEVDFTVSGLAE
ncbi:MAG: hypothetical protein IJ071_02625 [Ruminococcus sp.]|nr:hypothetical protein [Ruminococcus sp.]